jgi:lysophospholipase L1-like esterase
MRLLAFGDSFVAGAGDPEHLGWIGRAVGGRGDITLYNLGVRRETSVDIAARWRAETAPRLVDHEPVRLVFAFGANDCALEADGRTQRVATAETLKAALSTLTEAKALAPTLLVGPPPIPDAGRQQAIRALNDALKILAARLKAPFIEVFDRLTPADGPWIAEALAGDGVHPGAGGYRALADLVAAHPAWAAFLKA